MTAGSYPIFDIDQFTYVISVVQSSRAIYGSSHETVAVLLPGFAINW